MEFLPELFSGVLIALSPTNLGLIFVGVVIGLWVGAMPGLGSVNGVALLLPFTFVINEMTGSSVSAMIFLAAIYYGAMYGGAISSIAMGIPGASTAVATTFDGRPMALQGRADRALILAALASFAGGTVATVLFTLFAPPLASVALNFGPPEIFALMFLAFATFIGLASDDIPKTIFSICLGLVMSTVGFDMVSGSPRMQPFDLVGFSKPIAFLALAIGVYGIGEMLWAYLDDNHDSSTSRVKLSVRGFLDSFRDFGKGWKGTTIGSFIGFFVGTLPAAGATPGSMMSYGIAKLTSKEPEQFGKGSIDGLTAPESANNSASTGAMLPMLTLGIPGSPTTAVLLAGMVIWGLQPGPLLFSDSPEFVWPLVGSFYVSNVVAVLVNLALIPLFLWMLRTPFGILAPIIFVLSVVGTFAAGKNMFDVWLMAGIGIMALVLRMLDYPLAPAVLAIVLGPIAEPSLRQSLIFSDGSFSIFFTRPIAGTIMVIAILLVTIPLGGIVRNRMRKARRGTSGENALDRPSNTPL